MPPHAQAFLTMHAGLHHDDLELCRSKLQDLKEATGRQGPAVSDVDVGQAWPCSALLPCHIYLLHHMISQALQGIIPVGGTDVELTGT